MQEYQIFSVQGASVLPILDVRMSGFDWYMILEASGIRWNQCCGLKRPASMLSVLSFQAKSSSLVMAFGRSIQVSGIRVVFLAYV